MTTTQSVLAKKIALGKTHDQSAQAEAKFVATVENAIGLLGRKLKVPTVGLVNSCQTCKAETALNDQSLPGLFCSVRSETGELAGFICADAALVNGLVEILTFGDSVIRAQPVQRLHTLTDQSLTRKVLDQFLTGFVESSADANSAHRSQRLRIAEIDTKPEELAFALGNGTFCTTTISMDLGENGRNGMLVFGLSSEFSRAFLKRADGVTDLAFDQASNDLQMAKLVGELTLDLHCVLAQVPIKLQLLRNLKIGDLIPFQEPAAGEVHMLYFGTDNDGFCFSKGDVGSLYGRKAFRLGNITAPQHSPDAFALQPNISVSNEVGAN